MRHLVACDRCGRQFDASGREPGSRFRCSCGTLLTVARPEGHDASVVRCSSCGAPREDDAPTCRFCGSEFTLHERDLHTICPGCMARISDRARHCHYCGTLIAPQGTAGESVEETCPVCGDGHRLVSRGLGGRGITVLECGSCAGLWLGKEVFQMLETEARTRATSLADERTGHVPPIPGDRQSGPLYRPCVVCGKLMHRRNYGERSGIIVDMCHDHGLWFDYGELDQALRWVRDGGMAQADRIRTEKAQEQERRERFRRLTETPASSTEARGSARTRGGWGAAGVVGEIVAGVLETLFDLT
jgi:Zn-finger nucleic acid-binding protein/ribosomal protein L40E